MQEEKKITENEQEIDQAAAVNETETEQAAEQTAENAAAPGADAEDNFINVIEYDDVDSPEYEQIAASHSGQARFAGLKVEQRERYDPSKQPFLIKLQTFFLANKVFIIVGALAVALGLLLFFTRKPANYDYNTLIMCDYTIYDDDAYDRITDELCKFGEDINESGEVDMAIVSYQFATKEDELDLEYETILATQAFLYNEFGNSNHDYMIFISDEIHYDLICREYGEETFDSVGGRPQWIDLKDSPIAQEFKNLGYDEKMGILLVAVPQSDEKLMKRHDDAMRLLERYCEKYGL